MKQVFKILKSFWTFFYRKAEPELNEISEQEYLNIFVNGRKKEDIEASYKKAWEAKNFEIENYWKRANYFWAFQIASFAGYFTVLGSNAYPKNPQVLYLVVCIGFITSTAWALINRGSKTWQRHWEIHVDMLENEITGPLYKIVTTQKTFSVSKLNEIVSRFVVVIWFILGLKYFMDNITFSFKRNSGIDWLVLLSSVMVFYFIGAMFNGYGRGRFGNRTVKFYGRKFHTDK